MKYLQYNEKHSCVATTARMPGGVEHSSTPHSQLTLTIEKIIQKVPFGTISQMEMYCGPQEAACSHQRKSKMSKELEKSNNKLKLSNETGKRRQKSH